MRPILALLWSLAAVAVPAVETYEERAVAAVLMGEAWSEGESGMTAVVEVIRTRAVLRKTSLLSVVQERNRKTGVWAFSCLTGRGIDGLIRKFEKEPDYALALRLAQVAVRTPGKLPGLARGATHFSLAREKPYWAKGRKPLVVLGRHAFYRLP